MHLNKVLTYAAAFVIAMSILLSGALVIMPQLDATVAARAETDAVNAQNMVKETEIALLAEEFASIDTLRGERPHRIISVTAFSTSTGTATDAEVPDSASVTASISAVVYGLPAT